MLQRAVTEDKDKILRKVIQTQIIITAMIWKKRRILTKKRKGEVEVERGKREEVKIEKMEEKEIKIDLVLPVITIIAIIITAIII